MAEIKALFGGGTGEAINCFERENKLQLPQDYKDFIVKYNGGIFLPNTREIPCLSMQVIVDVLFGLGLRRDFDLGFWLREYREEILPGFIVIGADPGANLFLLGTLSEQRGVYYWDHTDAFPHTDATENTFKMSDSFSEFFDVET